MSDELTPRLQLACDAAREAGRLVLQYYRRDDLRVDLKSDASPVTIADREAEQLLRRRIAAAFPQDGILGEEFGEQPGKSGFRWILDPVDGTKSFIHGVPLFGVLIGIEEAGQSRIGVIYLPAVDEMVYAAARRSVDAIALLSGDGDFLPAVELVKREGLTFALVHGPRSGPQLTVQESLWAAADLRLPLDMAFLEPLLREG